MDTLQNLLNRINQILIRERTMEEERRKRGENFNIFSVLNLSRNETRLHSAFIAELLNPDGSHGLKDAFLKCFIKHIMPKDFEFVINSVKVNTEFSIGQKNEDATCGGRIDIIVTNNQRQALIIENKIDALEQEKQLERYCYYAKSNFSDYKLFYLTPEGCESSTISDEEKAHYKPISYRTHILDWLESCVGIAARHPLIRETIQQYIINLKKILNIMDIENKDRLVAVAISKEYVDSTLAIIDNGEDIKKKIRQNFLEELKCLAKQKELEVHIDENMCDLGKDQWVYLTQPSVSEIWAICIGWDNDTKGRRVYYGIGNTKEVKNEAKASVLESLPHIWRDNKQSTWWPYGWTHLQGENGNDWRDWTATQTLKDMANGKILRFIETEIIDKVLNDHLLEKIQDSIPDY